MTDVYHHRTFPPILARWKFKPERKLLCPGLLVRRPLLSLPPSKAPDSLFDSHRGAPRRNSQLQANNDFALPGALNSPAEPPRGPEHFGRRSLRPGHELSRLLIPRPAGEVGRGND